MRNKVADISIIDSITDGSTIMIGGFGVPGTPFRLIEALADHGAKNLTIIKNDANEANTGIDWLLQNNQVSHLITSHIGMNRHAIAKMNSGKISVDFIPQGILAERIRVAGAGMLGTFSDIGIGTDYSQQRQVISINGQEAIYEPALFADYALLHAHQADMAGNLMYAASARNFNPIMAMAAKTTIAEVEQLVHDGEISAHHIHTPAPFVDYLVKLNHISEAYDVVQR